MDMMNLSSNAHSGRQTNKENIPPSSKGDGSQAPRPKQRSAFSVLSENEQRGRSISRGSQFSKHSSLTSSSGFDVYVEEAPEVVIAASGREVEPGVSFRDSENAVAQSEDFQLLLELNSTRYNTSKDLDGKDSMGDADILGVPSDSGADMLCQGSCQETSGQDESLAPEEVAPVLDYANDIHRHLRELEVELRPKAGHLQTHPEITADMRLVLVDWMAEVVQEYKLLRETLHLAVNYLDRFLSGSARARRSDLQLVGVAALLVAAKYEEIYPPELSDFVYITDDTYTKTQLIQMEQLILAVLSFKMAAPTTNQFLHLFMSVHPVCPTTEKLAQYLAELSLLEIEPFLHFTVSIVAAAAYSLASYTVNNSLWPDSLSVFTGYTESDVAPCLTALYKLYVGAETHPQQTIREKYKKSKHCRVSLITPPAALPLP